MKNNQDKMQIAYFLMASKNVDFGHLCQVRDQSILFYPCHMVTGIHCVIVLMLLFVSVWTIPDRTHYLLITIDQNHHP